MKRFTKREFTIHEDGSEEGSASDYDRADYTISIGQVFDELGRLEDIFELMEDIPNQIVCYKYPDGTITKNDCLKDLVYYDPKCNSIDIYHCEHIVSLRIKDYGVYWWFESKERE